MATWGYPLRSPSLDLFWLKCSITFFNFFSWHVRKVETCLKNSNVKEFSKNDKKCYFYQKPRKRLEGPAKVECDWFLKASNSVTLKLPLENEFFNSTRWNSPSFDKVGFSGNLNEIYSRAPIMAEPLKSGKPNGLSKNKYQPLILIV